MAIQLPSDDEFSRDLWDALLEVAELEAENWTLVGAQMVLLHALEHNRTPPRRTSDLDVIVDVRSVAMTPGRFAGTLESLGYELEGVNADGVGHRFIKDRVKFDVLLPDGIGTRTSREVSPGARTVEVPGGTQALRRTQVVRAESEHRAGNVPRPNLLGAILVKARAVEVDDLPDAQREDLAFLLSLVSDPYEMRSDLSRNERRWLQRRRELLDSGATAWRGIGDADDGRLALDILIGE